MKRYRSDSYFHWSNPQHKSPIFEGRFWATWMRGVMYWVTNV